MKKILPVFLLLVTSMVSAQQKKPDVFGQKIMLLKRFLDLNHYQPLTWNDSSSALLYNKWIDKLDDEKLFFTQQDIALLEPYRYKLDDELISKAATPALNFFSISISLYQARLQKADSVIRVVMSKPLDFSKVDNITWPFNGFAASETEFAMRWQKFLKWQVLEQIADDLTDADKPVSEIPPADLSKMEIKAGERVKRIEQGYVKNLLLTPKEFISDKEEDYLNTISWCYDPHTSYMSIREKKEFDTEMSASEYSSGFDLEENEKGDMAISYLQPGGSAWRSGQLHTGDILMKVTIDGNEKKVADISGDELNSLLSGNSEADVEITVKTAAGVIKTVKLNKEKISDEGSIVKSYVLKGSKRIGYINLPGFYSRESESIKEVKDLTYDGCANDVSKEIVKLKKDTIAGLILDLRHNGGGSMWEAMQLAGIFIDIGPVASVKDKEGKVHFLKDPNRGTIYDGPLIVLTNGGSASASEFVSAVLQDYNRALIVGGSTYGKGTAQRVLPLDTNKTPVSKNYEDFVKVTEQKFYRVNGSTTQWKGVIPDISLPDIYADDLFKEKANRSALQPDNSKTGMYQPLPVLPVQVLKSKSEQRVGPDNYFKTISEFAKWIKDYNLGRVIPLQWAGYARHQNKNMEMFKLMGIEAKTVSSVTVSNNAFDRQRIDVSTEKSKEVNKIYLEHIQKDRYIAEANSIMIDWITK